MPPEPMIRMHRARRLARVGGAALGVSLAGSCVWATPEGGYEETGVLSTDFRFSAHGIEDPSSILAGRLSITWTAEGPRLNVSRLEGGASASAGAVFGGRDATASCDDPGTYAGVGGRTYRWENVGWHSGPAAEDPWEGREGSGPAAAGAESGCVAVDHHSPAAWPLLSGATARAGLDALWVWDTRELLANPETRSAFLDLVESVGIDRVFLHLVPAPGLRKHDGFVPFDPATMGALVAEIRRRGALVYALDGSPRYALRDQHVGVLRTVRRVVEHNRNAAPEERFFGVRFDIEPYVLPEFRGRREEILGDYLDLVERMSRITRRSELRLGLDIPFWLDGLRDEAGEPLTLVRDGVRRSVLAHLLGQVDDVVVMSYRTSAGGANGSVALSLGELDEAAEAGAEVYLGLETGELRDSELFDFEGPPLPGPPPDEGGPWVVMQRLEGDSARAWVVLPGGRKALGRALDRSGGNRRDVVHFASGKPVRVEADLQSFHNLGWDRMQLEVANIRRQLGGHPAFVGLAFHHYRTYAALLRRREVADGTN